MRAHWDTLASDANLTEWLHGFGVTYLQALRLAGPERAHRVEPASLALILEAALDADLAMTITVFNHGVAQSYEGPIQHLSKPNDWYHLRADGFHLQLHAQALNETWVVDTPGDHGRTASLELIDPLGNPILRVQATAAFHPPDTRWAALLAALAPAD